MYAKALIPGVAGRSSIPLLIATAGEGSVLIAQLHARGWPTYSGRSVEDKGAELQIMPERLAVTVDGQALLTDNTDPVSPEGWWEAADALKNRVVCVVLEWGAADVSSDRFGEQMITLVDSPKTAQATIPIVHAPA